ncbi:hypothetical protein [Methylomagnum sp.]
MAYKVDPIDLVLQVCKERCPEIHESLWGKLERRARVELGGDTHYIRRNSNNRMLNELRAKRDDREREPSGGMPERIANNHFKKGSR